MPSISDSSITIIIIFTEAETNFAGKRLATWVLINGAELPKVTLSPRVGSNTEAKSTKKNTLDILRRIKTTLTSKEASIDNSQTFHSSLAATAE